MASDLLAAGVIAGLGVVIHELAKSDIAAFDKTHYIPQDPFGLMNQCQTELKNVVGPQTQAAIAAYNAAWSAAGGSASGVQDEYNISGTATANFPPLDAAGQQALNSAPGGMYWSLPYVPQPQDQTSITYENGLWDEQEGNHNYSANSISGMQNMLSGTYANYGLYQSNQCGQYVSNSGNKILRTDLLLGDNANAAMEAGSGLAISQTVMGQAPVGTFPRLYKSWFAPGFTKAYVPGAYDNSSSSEGSDGTNDA